MLNYSRCPGPSLVTNVSSRDLSSLIASSRRSHRPESRSKTNIATTRTAKRILGLPCARGRRPCCGPRVANSLSEGRPGERYQDARSKCSFLSFLVIRILSRLPTTWLSSISIFPVGLRRGSPTLIDEISILLFVSSRTTRKYKITGPSSS